ncbi:MAG: hypothetical protein JWN15_1847 [Firmicutes bacterium]|nr:hypothetical protein [Bacillota bacterium]
MMGLVVMFASLIPLAVLTVRRVKGAEQNRLKAACAESCAEWAAMAKARRGA